MTTSFDLSQAQRQLYTAQQDYLQSMLNILIKRIDLEALINPPLQQLNDETLPNDYSNENNLFSLFILTLVLSCGTSDKESQSLTDLKTKKAALIEQMDRIGTELKSVEIAISELDTLKNL